jgi:plasmid maintenance system killer protein
MKIGFSTNKLQKQMNDAKEMVKAHGTEQAKKLRPLLTKLNAIPNLSVFEPPKSRPHRCHELTGNLAGTLSLDLDHPYRLLFIPDHNPLPTREDGGLDWSKVTAVIIKKVENTHGK